MIKDIEELKKLDIIMHKKLLVDLIMQSLLILYGQFMVNYDMNNPDSILSGWVKIFVTKEL